MGALLDVSEQSRGIETKLAEAKKEYEEGIEGLTMALQILRDYYAEKEDSSALLQQPEVSTHSKASGAATGIIGLLEVSQSDLA